MNRTHTVTNRMHALATLAHRYDLSALQGQTFELEEGEGMPHTFDIGVCGPADGSCAGQVNQAVCQRANDVGGSTVHEYSLGQPFEQLELLDGALTLKYVW
jgi:hypothetical protein